MTVAVGVREQTRRPVTVLALVTLLALLGLGAVGGGLVMIIGIGGESMMPDEYLDSLPLVSSWVVPGLILFVGFGVGSLATMYGVLARPQWKWLGGFERFTEHHWSWAASILLGVGQMIWIGIELISIPFSALMPTFGLVGLALAVLPWTSAVSRHLANSSLRS